MGLITGIYKKQLVHRYDDDRVLTYFTAADFPGLQAEPFSFDSDGNTLRGFFYSCAGCREDALVIFCHGIGGGHRSYMSEINALCRGGYRVFAYDNTGCFASDGESIGCLSRSLADLDHAIRRLKTDGIFQRYEKVFVIGHSWGGYAAGAVPLCHADVSKVVVISGFLSVETLCRAFVGGMKVPGKKAVLKTLLDFERAAAPDYWDASIPDAIRKGTAQYLLTQSTDDGMVPYESNIGLLRKTFPEIPALIYTGRKHNPNYLPDAVDYMDRVLGAYNTEVRKKRLRTLAEKQRFLRDTDWRRMTAQDPDFWEQVFRFLEN